MIDKIRAGKMHKTLDDDYYTNRIHVDDCAAVLSHLIVKDASGESLQKIYLGVDCVPVTHADLIDWLADEMGEVLSQDLDDVPGSRQVGSKRCSNKRLLESGYSFIYPGYQEGFRSILELEDNVPD